MRSQVLPEFAAFGSSEQRRVDATHVATKGKVEATTAATMAKLRNVRAKAI